MEISSIMVNSLDPRTPLETFNLGEFQKSWPTFFNLLDQSLLTFLERFIRLFRILISLGEIPAMFNFKNYFHNESIKIASTGI